MMESCYCGRSGELEDRKVVVDAARKEALACRMCGHTDDLEWLQPGLRAEIFAAARNRGQQTTQVQVAA
ncbi:MAG: hypothetical protein H0V83_05070 [Rubrobacter sp.]|nr:hypothetical protein [Rubrobacter sp.]